MLSLDEIGLKAEAMERLAAGVDHAGAAACRAVAMQWRLLEVQTAFLNALQPVARRRRYLRS